LTLKRLPKYGVSRPPRRPDRSPGGAGACEKLARFTLMTRARSVALVDRCGERRTGLRSI